MGQYSPEELAARGAPMQSGTGRGMIPTGGIAEADAALKTVMAMDAASKVVGKYEGQHFRFPLNVEAAEESHWVRFDMKEEIGAPLKEEEERSTLPDKKNKAINITPGKSFAEKTGEALGGIVGRAASGAVDLAVGAVKSTVNEFINDAAPGLTSLVRSIFGGGGSKSHGKGSITMYAPHTRAENVKVNWAGQSVGTVGAAMMAAGGTASGAINSLLDMNNATLEGLRNMSPTIRAELGAKLLGGVTGQSNLKDIETRTLGVAVNPHLEMFFTGIDLRTFSFDFKMAPRNSSEAREIQKIVHLFKYAAAPQILEGEYGRYWKYPWVFDIGFYNAEQTHAIQQCALSSIAVNHAGAGVNSTFYDNYPVETTLSLTFTELDVLTKGKIDLGY